MDALQTMGYRAMGESANFHMGFADFLPKDTTSPKNCSERLITLISTKIRIIRSIRRFRIPNEIAIHYRISKINLHI